MPAPTHSNHPNNYNNNNHIIHINAKTNNEPITTNLCPGAPPLDPAGGYAPRPPILALRARFFKQNEKNQIANKNPLFRRCAVTLRHNFQKFQTPTPPSPRLGYPKMPKNRSPPTALGPPCPRGEKKLGGGKCPHDENFGGGGPRGPHPAHTMFYHFIDLLPTVGSTPMLPFRE